jgi:hypothetical protein
MVMEDDVAGMLRYADHFPPLHYTQANRCSIFIHPFVVARFGNERYEKREMQLRVRERFRQLEAMDQLESSRNGAQAIPWYIVNAAQSIHDVQKDINEIVERTIDSVHKEEKPLGLLWKTASQDRQENKENQV